MGYCIDRSWSVLRPLLTAVLFLPFTAAGEDSTKDSAATAAASGAACSRPAQAALPRLRSPAARLLRAARFPSSIRNQALS